MGSLQWFPSLDKYPILSSNPCAYHDSCWGGQTESAGTCNGQHRYTDLESEGENKLYLIILAGLWSKKHRRFDIRMMKLNELHWLLTVLGWTNKTSPILTPLSNSYNLWARHANSHDPGGGIVAWRSQRASVQETTWQGKASWTSQAMVNNTHIVGFP